MILVCSCVCVCVHICVSSSLCGHMWRTEVNVGCPHSLYFPLYCLRQNLLLNLKPFGLDWFLSKLQRSFCLYFSSAGVTDMHHSAQLLGRSWALNSGPHTSALPPEPSPSPRSLVPVYSQSCSQCQYLILAHFPQSPKKLGTHEQSLLIPLNVPAPGNY